MKLKPLTIAAAAATLLASSTASANGYDITEDDGADYTVAFFQDNLTADGDGALGDVIRTPPAPVRRTLIRPRTSFVRQLILTVEQL
jgi:hypothetical protein